MAESEQEVLCTILGLRKDIDAGKLVQAYDDALARNREKLDRAEGRVHKQRAQKACDDLVKYDEWVERLRVEAEVQPLITRIRHALDKGQLPSAQVFLKRILEYRPRIKDSDLVMEIDALEAEIEEGLRQQSAAGSPALEPPRPGSPANECEPPSESRQSPGDEAPAPEETAPPEVVSAGSEEASDREAVAGLTLPEETRPVQGLTMTISGRRVHVISKTRTHFGRDGRNSDILLRVDHTDPEESKLVEANRRISRMHFFIEPIPGGVALVDGVLDEEHHRKPSAAGTYLNGEAVEVERLKPDGELVISVAGEAVGTSVAHWKTVLLHRPVESDYPPAFTGALPQWEGRATGVWMARQDLVEEDVLLLWTATPLGFINASLGNLWLLRLYDGYVFYDEAESRFIDLDEMTADPGRWPLQVVSQGNLTFSDPTDRLKS